MYISIWLLSNILIINLLCILSYLVILPIEKICKQFYCGYKITSRVLLLLQYVFLVFGFVRTYICVYNYFLFEFWFWGSFSVFFFFNLISDTSKHVCSTLNFYINLFILISYSRFVIYIYSELFTSSFDKEWLKMKR